MSKKGGSGSREKGNRGGTLIKDINHRQQPSRHQVRPNDPPPSKPPTKKGRG